MSSGLNEGVVPAVAPLALDDTDPLEQPIEEEFRAGTMTLSWDPDDGRIVIEVFPFNEAAVVGTRGRTGLKEISVRLKNGEIRHIACDVLGVSGGWNPNLHLSSHHRNRPCWEEEIAAFVPGPDMTAGMQAAGAAAGRMTTAAALADGARVAGDALAALGRKAPAIDLPEATDAPMRLRALWHVAGSRRAWVDQQNDVTVKDIQLAHQEGFRSVEHLKRYTTLGMATDQGKTGNVLGLALMAGLTGQSIPQTGATVYRPPYTPVALGALAGRSRGADFRPRRLTPSHAFAAEQGAVFVEAGQWMRAQYFPRPGESHWRQTVDREVLATRRSVGICDVTTLGKIDVQGPDAAVFLDRIYANGFAKLPVGKVRYGIMLREDGMAMDDGTTARLAEDHFVTTTTTANAVGVFRHMEFARQCLWPTLDVQLVSTTEAWAQFSVAGPNARRLLERIVDAGFDLGNQAFPYMACGALTVCGGIRARLFRISFSGELAYEIAVPTRYGDGLARALMAAGRELDAVFYGTEALGVMRIEKGHVAGNELNGTTSALALGLGRMVSTRKDFIGSVMSRREALVDPDGLRIVGLQPVDHSKSLAAGAHLIARGRPATAANDEGYLTSAAHSPVLGHMIGLGFLRRGHERLGEILRAVNPLRKSDVDVEVVALPFVDPEGVRVRG